SVIFISHDIDKVMQITDHIAVLREGEVADELVTANASHAQIVEMIVGSSVTTGRTNSPASAARPVFARVENLAGKMLEPSTITVGKGEILGLTGLIGSGYEEVPYLLFGARPCRSGSLALGDATIPVASFNPRAAFDRG